MISSDPNNIQDTGIQMPPQANEAPKAGILKSKILGRQYIAVSNGNLQSVDNPAMASSIKDVHTFVSKNHQLLSFEQVKMLKAATKVSSSLPALVQAIVNLINGVVGAILGKSPELMRHEIHSLVLKKEAQIQTVLDPIKKELSEKIKAKIKANNLMEICKGVIASKREIVDAELRLNSSMLPQRSERIKLAELIRRKQTYINKLIGENRPKLKECLEELRESDADNEFQKLAKRQLLNESFKELSEELSGNSNEKVRYHDQAHVRIVSKNDSEKSIEFQRPISEEEGGLKQRPDPKFTANITPDLEKIGEDPIVFIGDDTTFYKLISTSGEVDFNRVENAASNALYFCMPNYLKAEIKKNIAEIIALELKTLLSDLDDLNASEKADVQDLQKITNLEELKTKLIERIRHNNQNSIDFEKDEFIGFLQDIVGKSNDFNPLKEELEKAFPNYLQSPEIKTLLKEIIEICSDKKLTPKLKLRDISNAVNKAWGEGQEKTFQSLKIPVSLMDDALKGVVELFDVKSVQQILKQFLPN